MSAASLPVSEGTVVDGRYEVGPVIGSGAMGRVHRAHDRRLGRDVAVKVLRADLAADVRATARFADEASAAARLVHPNVVTVFDSGEHDGAPFIVMECLAGDTLADALVSGEPLSATEVRRVGLDVAAALGAAHDLGIVHRDVKPGNILFGGDGTAKVGDFGIAKTTEGLDLTLTGQMVGTPAYMAPERLGGGPATSRSDLYSLAVVLYHAAAGRKPFDGDTAMAVAHAITATEPDSLADLRPDLDAGLVAAIHRGLARRPEDRFASAREMAEALAGPRAPVKDAPTLTQPAPTRVLAEVSPVERARRASGLRESHARIAAGVVGAAALVVALLLALTGGSGGGEAPASASTSSTVAPASTPVPDPLQGAIDRLDSLVRR